MNIIEQLLSEQNEQTLYARCGSIELHRKGTKYWLFTGGLAIQSVFDTQYPQVPVLSYQQSMLVVLALLPGPPSAVLNLGLGLGAFERAFASHQEVPKIWVAIENSQDVVNLVQQHLPLAQSFSLKCADAQQWLIKDKQQYELILCDLFDGQHHADCLNSAAFFAALRARINAGGVVAVNLAPQTERQMVALFAFAKQYFTAGFLTRFPDSGNILLCLTTNKLEEFSIIEYRAQQLEALWSINFRKILEQIHCF